MAQDVNLKWILNCTKLGENIITSINRLRDEITNLKDIIIKELEEYNERFRTRC